ncbi:MAG TPA: hypothetical protein DCG53_12865, partial [Syntrophus sp. (in: bacteria)]|nr:hypothetical protein [Syntrophus sp. (in: bacteria)]
ESPAVNTEDAGAELTYNKRNRISTGIKWADIADKNTALKVKETTKQNVYPRPDYQGMIDKGANPMIVHLVKQVYDSLAAAPVTAKAPTDADLKLYIDAVNRVMKGTIAWSNDNEAVGTWARKQISGRPLSMIEMTTASHELLDAVYPNGWKNFREEVRILGGNKALRALQPGREEGIKAQNAVKDGWPSKQEAWQKRGYKIISRADLKISEGYRYELDKKVPVFFLKAGETTQGRFESRELADEAKDAFKPMLLLDKYGRIKGQFDTETETVESARALVKRELKTRISDKGTAVESAERTGEARRMAGEDVSSDRLQETFGFKGVNFGNWMKGESNQAERQLHLNHAYDSFMDLVEILNVPPQAMSLNGMLGIAVGAQGAGRNAAHFVPGVNEINLTRTSGAGSLAHEFAHALDHYFATQAGLAANKEPFLTEHTGLVDAEGYTKRAGKKVKAFGEDIRPEIVADFKTIVEAMNKKQMSHEEIQNRRQEATDKAKKNVERWLKAIGTDFREASNAQDNSAEFTRLADRILALDLGEGMVSIGGKSHVSPVVSELRDLYKKENGRPYSVENIKSLQANLDHYAYLNSEKASERDHIPQQVSTDYAKNATTLDKEKGGKKYWSTNLEKFARAFDAYVSDTLEEKAAKNSYLSHAGRSGDTVPKGLERTAINKAFDGLVDTIKTKEESGHTVLYSLEEQSNVQTEKESFGKQLDDFQTGKLKSGESLTVGSTPRVLTALGAEQLPITIDQNTLRKVLEDKHGLSPDLVKQITEQLHDPIMVFDSATQPDSKVVMTELTHDGKTVVVAVHLSKEKKHHIVNDIASIYTKDNDKIFGKWIDDGLLRYMNKKKSREWFQTRGLQLPKVETAIRGYRSKIIYDYDLVKRQYSFQPSGQPYRLGAVPLRDMVRHLAGIIKGISVEERNGDPWIVTKSGHDVRIMEVAAINPDRVALTIDYHYGQAGHVAGKIAGMYNPTKPDADKPRTIHLVRDVAGIWTLSHEFHHFLEDIGVISNADKALLNNKIAALIKRDPHTYGYLQGRSKTEQRAEWIGRTLVGVYDAKTATGRIIQKIRNIIDRIINALGIRTAAGVVRDIETGNIYTRPGTQERESQVQFAVAAGTNRSPAVSAAAGQIITSYYNNAKVKEHQDYAAAKAGDREAAARLVEDMVKAETLETARQRFGSGV